MRVFIPCSKPLRFFFHSAQLLVQIMPSKVPVFTKERIIAAFLNSEYTFIQRGTKHALLEEREFIELAPNGGTQADQRINLLSEILESTKHVITPENAEHGNSSYFHIYLLAWQKKKSTAETFFRNFTYYFINTFI